MTYSRTRTVEVKKVYVPFAYRFYYRLRFHYRCNYRARALCVFITICVLQLPCTGVMRLHFPLFFYSVSSGSGREYAASGSHHVREPGLSSCAWKRVVVTRACGVRPARQTLHGRRRDRGASARGRVKLAIFAVVRVGD